MANSAAKRKKTNVQKVAIDAPEARDEGPRALSLDGPGQRDRRNPNELLWGRRALDLADIALGTKAPSPPRNGNGSGKASGGVSGTRAATTVSPAPVDAASRRKNRGS